MDFIDLLDLSGQSDLEISSGGIRARHRPDIAPLAFETVIIGSVYDSLNEAALPAFLDGANLDFFEELFRNCNGMHVGATKFGVFGFTTGDQSIGVPWDIELPNAVTRATRPSGTLIVGTSTETDKSGMRLERYHSIQRTPEIHVTPSDDFSMVLRSYGSVSDWLQTEVSLALSDREHW